MPRVSDIHLMKQEAKPAIVVRTKTTVKELPQVIGASYGKLGQYLAETGETISDVPFVAYYNWDKTEIDVEIGFPVATALPGKGDVKPGAIVAGYKVFCMYRGPYKKMVALYTEMTEWIEKNGYEMLSPAYEHYYNGPELPEEELLTKVMIPVRKTE